LKVKKSTPWLFVNSIFHSSSALIFRGGVFSASAAWHGKKLISAINMGRMKRYFTLMIIEGDRTLSISLRFFKMGLRLGVASHA
jgi:hypothetical protein